MLLRFHRLIHTIVPGYRLSPRAAPLAPRWTFRVQAVRRSNAAQHRSLPVPSEEGAPLVLVQPRPLCLCARCTSPLCQRLGSSTALAAGGGGGGGAAHFAQVPVSALYQHPDTDGRIRVHVTPRSGTRITVTSAHRAVYFTAASSPTWVLNILSQ